jgi:hypothetical protein
LATSREHPRSGPAAVFESLREELTAAIQEDREVAVIFEGIRNFSAPLNTPEDARRVGELAGRGAEDLGIKVGTLPLAIGPGLAFMYDLALEGIRANPSRVNSRILKNTRLLRAAAGLFDVGLLNVGHSTVTALEQALEDDEYAERLRHRADELGYLARDQFPTVGCDFCQVVVHNTVTGEYDITCPTQAECESLGVWFWLFLLLMLIVSIWDWLWG